MAGELTFITAQDQTIARELLILYLNTGTTAEPVWSAIGNYVSDSSMDMDWAKESAQDILGNTRITMKKPVITQVFDPLPLTAGDPAVEKLWNLGVKEQNAQALASLDLLVAHLYAGSSSETTAFFAERYPASALSLTGLGGEGGGNISMPIEATFGGTRQVGTVSRNAETGAVTFTKST